MRTCLGQVFIYVDGCVPRIRGTLPENLMPLKHLASFELLFILS